MTPAHSEKALARLRRIEGQIRGIHKMLEDDRYCVDILTQTSAVIAALHGVEDLVMENHLNTCVAEAMRSDDPERKREKIDEVMTVITKFRKHG
ncbi:MAG TPA: metal-sensitive transcriptional regulator [Spirochaetia bacterium]|nr:metal-sensitive transcriptional regulator [Spirochaetia bacterium]